MDTATSPLVPARLVWYRSLVCCTSDYDSTKHRLVVACLVVSMIGSVCLVVSGDAPWHGDGPLYHQDDVVRLLNSMHGESPETTVVTLITESSPTSPPDSTNKDFINQASRMAQARLKQLVSAWLPAAGRAATPSSNALINEMNYLHANYVPLQATSVLFTALANILLLLTWLWLNLLKNHGFQQEQHATKSISIDSVKRLARENVNKAKQCWHESASSPSGVLERGRIRVAVICLALHLVLLVVLLCRPNLLTTVLYELTFICLCVICLAEPVVVCGGKTRKNTCLALPEPNDQRHTSSVFTLHPVSVSSPDTNTEVDDNNPFPINSEPEVEALQSQQTPNNLEAVYSPGLVRSESATAHQLAHFDPNARVLSRSSNTYSPTTTTSTTLRGTPETVHSPLGAITVESAEPASDEGDEPDEVVERDVESMLHMVSTHSR